MMEDFSGLALPPLFGEHILEAELEPGGVELGPGEVRGWNPILKCEIQNLWCSLVGTGITWGWRSFLTGCVSVKDMEKYFTSSRCIMATSLCIKQIDSGVPLEISRQKHRQPNTNTSCLLQVELGPGGNELPESMAQEDEERRALDKRKYLALSRKCKEIEQVCASFYMRIFGLLQGMFLISCIISLPQNYISTIKF